MIFSKGKLIVKKIIVATISKKPYKTIVPREVRKRYTPEINGRKNKTILIKGETILD